MALKLLSNFLWPTKKVELPEPHESKEFVESREYVNRKDQLLHDILSNWLLPLTPRFGSNLIEACLKGLFLRLSSVFTQYDDVIGFGRKLSAHKEFYTNEFFRSVNLESFALCIMEHDELTRRLQQRGVPPLLNPLV